MKCPYCGGSDNYKISNHLVLIEDDQWEEVFIYQCNDIECRERFESE